MQKIKTEKIKGIPFNLLNIVSLGRAIKTCTNTYSKNIIQPYFKFFKYLISEKNKKLVFKTVSIWILIMVIMLSVGHVIISSIAPKKDDSSLQLIMQQKEELKTNFNGVGMDNIDMGGSEEQKENSKNQYVALKLFVFFGGIKGILLLLEKPTVLVTYTPNFTGVGKEFVTDKTWYQKIDFKKLFKNATAPLVEAILYIGWLVFILFFAYKALCLFNPLIGDEDDPNGKIQDFVTKLIITVLMFLLYPFFFSVLIEFFNAITQLILSVGSIKAETTITGTLFSFLDQTTDSFKRNLNFGDDLFQNAIAIFKFIFQTASDFIANINPVNYAVNELTVLSIGLPILFAVIALIFLSICGVVRVFSVALLYVLYGLIVPFHMFEKSEIVQNYWKEVVSNLFQQLIYAVIIKMGLLLLLGLIEARAFTDIIGLFIYSICILSIFGFINTAPMFAARIYGNLFSTYQDSQISGMFKNVATKPIKAGVGLASTFLSDSFLSNKEGSISNSINDIGVGKTRQERVNSIGGTTANDLPKNAYKKQNTILKDSTSSIQAKSFKNNKFAVTDHKSDIASIGIDGQFFASNQNNGFTSLYQTKEDAIKDKAEGVYDYKGSVNVIDSTNYAGKSAYSTNNNIPTLKDNITDKEAEKNLNQTKQYNTENNINGYTTTLYPQSVYDTYGNNKNIPKDTPRISKTTVYSDSINNKPK